MPYLCGLWRFANAYLKGLHNEGRTVILITHDNDIAAQAKRVIKIKDGKVESDSGQIVPVEELQTAGA